MAGMAIVDVHGATDARTMMPLFESYLDSKRPGLTPEQEAEYDLVSYTGSFIHSFIHSKMFILS